MSSSALLVALGLATAAVTSTATAQVRRCVQPDLDVIYTDRSCEAFDAVRQRARGQDAGNRSSAGASRYRGGCPRTLPDLMAEIGRAIDNRDVNRLASVYHWPGMSSRAATRVMNQLTALVHRPLIDIVPVMAQPALPRRADGGHHGAVTTMATPIALRIEQTQANSGVPSRTVFGLKEYFGCMWISG